MRRLYRSGGLRVEVATRSCVVQDPWCSAVQAALVQVRKRNNKQRQSLIKRWLPMLAHTKQGLNAHQVLSALLVPANTAMCGTLRPYVQRGARVPTQPPTGLGASSAGWGGMDAGGDMLYPAQTVDGLVHLAGGADLRKALAQAAVATGALNEAGQPVRCAEGGAVITASFGRLASFDLLAHTPPPLWPVRAAPGDDAHAQWATALRSCYTSSLSALRREAQKTATHASTSKEPLLLVASPLLGAGTRGAPVQHASREAVAALAATAHDGTASVDAARSWAHVRMVARDQETMTALSHAFDDCPAFRREAHAEKQGLLHKYFDWLDITNTR